MARLLSQLARIVAVVAVLCAGVSAVGLAQEPPPGLYGTITLRDGTRLSGEIKLADLSVIHGAGIGSLHADYGAFRLRVGDQEVTVAGRDVQTLDAEWVNEGTDADPRWTIRQITIQKWDGTQVVGKPTWLLAATTVHVVQADGVVRRVHAFPLAQKDFSPGHFLQRIEITSQMPPAPPEVRPNITTAAPTPPDVPAATAEPSPTPAEAPAVPAASPAPPLTPAAPAAPTTPAIPPAPAKVLQNEARMQEMTGDLRGLRDQVDGLENRVYDLEDRVVGLQHSPGAECPGAAAVACQVRLLPWERALVARWNLLVQQVARLENGESLLPWPQAWPPPVEGVVAPVDASPAVSPVPWSQRAEDLFALIIRTSAALDEVEAILRRVGAQPAHTEPWDPQREAFGLAVAPYVPVRGSFPVTSWLPLSLWPLQYRADWVAARAAGTPNSVLGGGPPSPPSEEARAAAGQLLTEAETWAGTPQAPLAPAANVLAVAAAARCLLGHTTEGVADVDRLLALADELEDPDSKTRIMLSAVHLYNLLGQREKAWGVVRSALNIRGEGTRLTGPGDPLLVSWYARLARGTMQEVAQRVRGWMSAQGDMEDAERDELMAYAGAGALVRSPEEGAELLKALGATPDQAAMAYTLAVWMDAEAGAAGQPASPRPALRTTLAQMWPSLADDATRCAAAWMLAFAYCGEDPWSLEGRRWLVRAWECSGQHMRSARDLMAVLLDWLFAARVLPTSPSAFGDASSGEAGASSPEKDTLVDNEPSLAAQGQYSLLVGCLRGCALGTVDEAALEAFVHAPDAGDAGIAGTPAGRLEMIALLLQDVQPATSLELLRRSRAEAEREAESQAAPDVARAQVKAHYDLLETIHRAVPLEAALARTQAMSDPQQKAQAQALLALRLAGGRSGVLTRPMVKPYAGSDADLPGQPAELPLVW